MDKVVEIIMGITSALLENTLSEKLKNAKEKSATYKYEKETINIIEKDIKDAFEKEKLAEYFMIEEHKLNKEMLFYSDTDKDKFVQGFFEKNPELKYMHTKELVNIINGYIDRINEIINEFVSTEGKIIINTIKKENEKQTQSLLQNIKEEHNEIKSELKEINNSINNTNNKYNICCDEEYTNRIVNLYKIQKFTILKEKDFFIAKQNIGIVQIQGIVFPFFSESSKISYENMDALIENISKISNIQQYQFIHVVSNVYLDAKYKKMLESYNVIVHTEENVINQIMDFDFYLHSIVDEYENSELKDHYIEVYDENTGEPLQYSINDFINDGYGNALLILGDYGCGKTSFLLNLAYSLAKSCLKRKKQYIPLYIPLKDYSKAINFENLFTDFFNNKCNISNSSIEAFYFLLKYKKFIILFDGFDEVAKRVNYDVKFEIFNEICKYGINDTKVLVTCRPNYFQEKREYKRLIENAYLHFEPNSTSLDFEETYIRELDEEQISKYIHSFSNDLNKLGLNSADVERFIKRTHDLMDLSKRPFLLSIIVKTLPKLIKELKGKDNLDEVEVNAAKLYDKYVDMWLDREDSKGKTLISKTDKLHFCKYIAYRLFEDDKYYLHFSEFPDEIRKHFTNLSNIDEIDYFSHDIQSCSFMNTDGLGNFKFIHKSFMEYFVATVICDKLQKKRKLNAEYLNQILCIRGISAEISLFINDLFKDNQIIRNKVFSALESNIDLVDDKVRENIITILTKTKSNISNLIENNKDYVGSDFSHAVIKNATIENANFSNATFYNVHMENVKFINCTFEQTYFQKAILNHVDFSNQSLEYADMSYCEINNCKFVNSILSDCQMMQSRVTSNDFEGCDMSGINVGGTSFNHNFCEDVIGLPYEMM